MKPALLLLALLPALAPAQPDRFGLPACQGPGRELADRAFFVVCYDSALKIPLWTAHELRPGQLQGAYLARRPRSFRQDEALSGARARNADYRASGYSRGHMVPAEDLAWSDEAIAATFLLSNTVPQRQSVNAGVWRRLESAVREIATCSEAVYVITGPVFHGTAIEHIGAGQVAVPTQMFKVVLAVNGESREIYAAVVPNADTGRAPLSQFATPVAEVERLTGLDFFSRLGAGGQRRLEQAGHSLDANVCQ